MQLRSLAALALLLGGLTFAGCGGQSAEEKAQSQVCDARADIQSQLTKLQGLTLTTASIGAIQESISAIGDDVTQIKDAQGDLSGDRKQAVQDAVETFGSQLSSIAGDLVSGLSSGEAEARLQSAFRTLATNFRQAFEPVGCS